MLRRSALWHLRPLAGWGTTAFRWCVRRHRLHLSIISSHFVGLQSAYIPARHPTPPQKQTKKTRQLGLRARKVELIFTISVATVNLRVATQLMWRVFEDFLPCQKHHFAMLFAAAPALLIGLFRHPSSLALVNALALGALATAGLILATVVLTSKQMSGDEMFASTRHPDRSASIQVGEPLTIHARLRPKEIIPT